MNSNSLASLLARRHWGPGSLRSTTRTVSVVLSATALVPLGAAAVAPALASTVPSMNTVGNDTSVAVQGPNHSLRFYWATNGTPG
jgi:hypothetical protein